jgi:ABC-type antimicrobial peptide transport system permease subunit
MIVDSEMAWGKSDDSLELLYGRIPENDKEIAISHHTAIRMGLDAETELPYKSFFVDLSKPMYGDAFSDSINLSSVFENGFEIVGVFEDNDFDAAFFSDTFETVKKDYYDYYIFDGYFVQNDNNATAKNFNRLLEANIRWKDVSARLMYDFKTSVNELKSYEILALVFFATLFCGICILYISSNIKGKSKLIGIYKSLGFSDADQQLVLICEAFIVGIIYVFFSLMLFRGTIQWINWYYGRTLFEYPFKLINYQLLQSLIIEATAVIVLLLSSYFYSFICLRKRPFDLIHNKHD